MSFFALIGASLFLTCAVIFWRAAVPMMAEKGIPIMPIIVGILYASICSVATVHLIAVAVGLTIQGR